MAIRMLPVTVQTNSSDPSTRVIVPGAKASSSGVSIAKGLGALIVGGVAVARVHAGVPTPHAETVELVWIDVGQKVKVSALPVRVSKPVTEEPMAHIYPLASYRTDFAVQEIRQGAPRVYLSDFDEDV